MILMSIRGRARRKARGYESEPFALFVTKSVVIAALVLFFTYVGFRQALRNDRLIEEGREDEVLKEMQE